MADQIRLVFFLCGCCCFAYVAFIDGHTKRNQRVLALGWLLFLFPLLWETVFEAF